MNLLTSRDVAAIKVFFPDAISLYTTATHGIQKVWAQLDDQQDDYGTTCFTLDDTAGE